MANDSYFKLNIEDGMAVLPLTQWRTMVVEVEVLRAAQPKVVLSGNLLDGLTVKVIVPNIEAAVAQEVKKLAPDAKWNDNCGLSWNWGRFQTEGFSVGTVYAYGGTELGNRLEAERVEADRQAELAKDAEPIALEELEDRE